MHTVTGTDIDEAARLLTLGETVAIPTETVYGLAANALDEQAVLKIFKTKQRPEFDPLIVHVPSVEAVSLYADEFPEKAQLLARHFWPGPLTIILKKKPMIPDLVTSGLDTVGLRVPRHPMALELLRSLDFPLAAPSANPFGYVSPTTASHVYHQFSGQIPYILDGGPCGVGIESTIVGFENGECLLYRLGGLTIEQISEVIGEVKVQVNVSSNPRAPGMLKSHYAPSVPLKFGNLRELIEQNRHLNCGIICLKRDFETTSNIHTVIETSPEGNLDEAARNIFAAMRTLEHSGVDVILAEHFPDKGLGIAINDRLRRAMA
jgi:L-threonylcarbamoyladenylate synthase